MNLPQSLTTPTRFSKYLAVLAFVTLPILGFLLGIRYQEIFNQAEKIQEENVLLIDQPTPTTTPLALPTVDPSITANWKTYRNEKNFYELKYPYSFNFMEHSNYTVFTDGNTELHITNYYSGTGQPFLSTEQIRIGGENAKKYNHILGKYPDQVGFIIIQLSHNNKDLTISAQSLNKKPLSEDQLEVVDQILSTFKFIGNN